MYIEPNTVIKILRNVPLDPTFDHTIYFDNATAQHDYFSGKAKYVLTRQSYQRVQKGWMRVNIEAENLFDCNYIMFQNQAFGTKWFYAFLKSVEYVNNTVSQIEFEIDDMQSWFFDYSLDQCFVEREHSATDNIYENIVEENVNLGDEYVANSKETYDMNNMKVCILANRVIEGETVDSKVIGNIYTPLRVIIGDDPHNPQAIDALLDQYNEGDIVAIYQYPAKIGNLSTPDAYRELVQITGNENTIDGYTPKNKKLFCHPYNFLLVSNNSGEVAEYRWEDWRRWGQIALPGMYVETSAPTGDTRIEVSMSSGDPPSDDYFVGRKITIGDSTQVYTITHNFTNTYTTPTTYTRTFIDFEPALVSDVTRLDHLMPADGTPFGSFYVRGVYASTPAVMCYPIYYRNIQNSYDDGLVLSNFPQCAWSGDVFKAWWAQNKASFVTSGITTVLSSIGRMAASGGATAIPDTINIAANVAGSVAKIVDIKNTPSQTHGQTQTDSLNPGMRRLQFDFYKLSIKAQYAKIIDDYFERYGYAIKQNKIPNRNVRPHWCYTKTIGCTITGSIPADSAKKICDIYNNGITFWKNGNEVGNYALDNRV